MFVYLYIIYIHVYIYIKGNPGRRRPEKKNNETSSMSTHESCLYCGILCSRLNNYGIILGYGQALSIYDKNTYLQWTCFR